jgi:hypothetical protein
VAKVGTSKGRRNNGKLHLRTYPECSVSEPYRSPDWALVPAKLAQGLNSNTTTTTTSTTTTTNNNNNNSLSSSSHKIANMALDQA